MYGNPTIAPIRESSQQPIEKFRRHAYLARKGEKPTHIFMIEEGWATGYKTLRDGRRHIARIYLPGDICDPIWLTSDEVDQMVIASTSIRLRKIEQNLVNARLSSDADFARDLAVTTLMRLRAHSEWIITLGCKSAVERIGLFFCEILTRLNPQRSGEAICEMPLSQQDIGEYTGMTPVHVCRTIRKLREDGLIVVGKKELLFKDYDRLAELCGFDDRYLRGTSDKEIAYRLIDMA